MSIASKIISLGIAIMVLHQCDAPRRALITLASARTDYEYTSQGQSGKYTAETGKVRSSKQNATVGSSAFEVGYKSITDRETNLTWEPHYDNPTSMLRYQMEDQDFSKRLPRFEELVYFFEKVGSEMRTNSNGEVSGQIWLKMDGYYISSTEVYSPDNKKLYRGISWNTGSNSFETVNLAPGDLVNILFINQ